MKPLVLSYSALLFGTFLLLAGIGLLGTLVSMRLDATGSSSLTIGLVGGAYFFGLIVGTRYAGRVIGAVGHIRAFAAFASILSVATLSFTFVDGAEQWAGLRFINGFCLAGLFMCLESWLNAQTSNEQRGRILSLYMIAVYLGQGTGQMLLPLPDPGGFTRFMVCAAFISLAVVPIAMTRIAAPTPSFVGGMSLRRLYALSPLGIGGAFASGLSLGAFYVLAPVFTRTIGLDVSDTARFMGLVIVGGLVLQWPIGHVSDRIDRRFVLVAVSVGLVAVSGVFVVAEHWSTAALVPVAPLLGSAIFTLYPLSVAHANDRLEPDKIVAVSAGLITAYGLGAAIGPPAASALMQATGPGGLFTFIAGVGVAIAAFTLWRMRQRAPVPTEEQTVFVPLPRTTPIAGALDPRGEGDAPWPQTASTDDGAGDTPVPASAASGDANEGLPQTQSEEVDGAVDLPRE